MPHKDPAARRAYYKQYARRNREKIVERYRRERREKPEINRRARQRYYRKNKVAITARHRERHQKHPEKVRAHRVVLNAKRRGALKPQPCEVCGEIKVDAHHDDYAKPLEVRWFCRRHHIEHHQKEKQRDGRGK